MNILLSNDDGYAAEGLRELRSAVEDLAAIVSVAPDRDRSGASNSLTLDGPLRCRDLGDNAFSVNGTPTDCVHLAITGLLDYEPDMVLSGINHGANLGDDVLYSGTVAAAMEGRFLGLPAIAMSLVLKEGGGHYKTAAQVARNIVLAMRNHPLPNDIILNVNVPDLPFEQLKGFKATRLGNRHRAEPVIKAKDPKGRTVYWIGAAGPEQDAGPGTDFHAVKEGLVSVTPLHFDLTRHGGLNQIDDWLDVLPS